MIISDPITIAIISAGSTGFGILLSNLGNFVNQHFDRHSKQKELVFNAALSQAKRRIELGMEVAKLSGADVELPDETRLAADYYKWLDHLYRTGNLPKEAIEAEEKAARVSQELEEKRIERIRVHNERTVQNALKNPSSARYLLGSTKDLSVFSEEQLNALQKTAAQLY